MPSNKDRGERTKIVKKSAAKIYEKRYGVQIRRDSGLNEPLQKAAKEQGTTPVKYILKALQNQLIADGYMEETPPDPAPDENA